MNSRYAAVVLAGGLSSRMKQFKPLLPLGGGTITDHAIATFAGEGVDVFLVAGYRKDDIAAGIGNKDITLVYNPDYEKGMFSSVQAGVRRLKPGHRAFFILPVDIPLVRPATVRRLMAAAGESPDGIIYPLFGGKRGHPPLIPSGLVPGILEWGGNGGLKAVLHSREETARGVPVPDRFILFDIDTPEDYQALLEGYRRYEIPTEEECEVILNDICKVTPDRILHSRKVAEIAVAFGQALDASGTHVDVGLIRSAAVLHDIAKGVRKHDIAGGRILDELGFGKTGDIVRVHSDLAGGDVRQSLETKIVYLADKFVEGEKIVTLDERYSSANRRFKVTPEIEAAIFKRLQVARSVKGDFEGILGYPLEKVISG